ncbi:uncharacterized protein UDID_15537 [Ustilago sp. UG-2017a]|nr:uncharacterized protein UDID_15537 [Ustilago sp. UG-2017a]
MQSILSTIFPCCFPSNRHTRSSGDNTERTPLLNADRSHSIHSGAASSFIGDSGVVTPGSETKRNKHKKNSVLPSPSYDAHVLKSIVDDFKGNLISVDSTGEKGAGLLLDGGDAEQSTIAEAEQAVGKKHVTPVHTLRLSVSSGLRPRSTTKLVDIWSDTPTDPTTTPANAGSGTNTPTSSNILSYSAAAKRGKKANAKNKKASAAVKGKEGPSVEQKTYETLAEMARAKPLVHDWDLQDDGAEHAPSA